MRTKNKVMLSMTQDKRWHVRFRKQYGWPDFRRWGTTELLHLHMTAYGGWLRQEKYPEPDLEQLCPYYWTIPDKDLESFLLALAVWLSVAGDKFDKLRYVEGGLKGIKNWKRRNGKDYPDESDDASTTPGYREGLGLQRP
jgi:hypothetical protein